MAVIDMDLPDEVYPEAFSTNACYLDATEMQYWESFDVNLTFHLQQRQHPFSVTARELTLPDILVLYPRVSAT